LVLVLATVLSVTAVIVTGVPAKAVDDSNIILGTDGKITRAQWLHDLVYVFGMAVEEESLPDNYFADLDQSHKYYEDILLAVEYGVVDVEVGGLLNPDAFVTRAYAATTLNFCLGYQLSEEESYTFSDSADCTDPASAQIALNRGWFALAEGKFAPETLVTEKEVEAMMDDATAVLEGQIVDAGYESKYEFAEDVTVIPEETVVTKDEDGKLRIPHCPVDLLVGDKIAVYFNGIPSFYKITVLSFRDTVTVLEVEDLESDQALKDVDAQGVLTTDAMEIVAAEGVDVTVEDDTSAVSTYSVKKVKNISAELPVSFGGITGKVSAKIKNPYIDYYVKSNKVYVALCGETEVKYGISGSLAGAAGLSKGLPLFTCNVGGIGSIDVTVNVDFAGSASGTVTGFLIAGVEVEKGVGVRAVKNFTQKEYYTSVEGETRVGLRASLGITDIPVIKAYVYAEVGVKANFSKKTYQDESTPKTCTHFAAYLFASYGASASAKFGIWSVSESITHTIYDANNSPVRIVNHYEDGNLVPKCTRGTTYPNYFTTASSRWSGCGWTSSNGAYALNADGTPFKLYNYTLNTANEATITKYNGNAWTVHIPSELDGYKVVAIGSNAFQNKSLRSVTIPDSVTSIGNCAFESCINLREVTLSKNLTKLGYRAFAYTALTRIEIPKFLDEATISGYYTYEFKEGD
ncbi:MAG: leucine-rich repeat protein, partial [Clostridia bacterium]|nr:leucine-rich repeat protein [Clostridia bacterium]